VVDSIIFPNEPDIPGVTFLSPVEWAPWMETIWFGNIYEYRSAFFHDVMYSNNKPSREGALLYRDSERSLLMALLYQRYKRFDVESYSLSNATFFNIFSTESLRIGRYKIPLTNEVILCITDPLTFSEMKRYLNSFNAFKWFRSKFFQQKRKRQYILSMPVKETDVKSSTLSDFVYLIEYGRLAMSKRSQDPFVKIPILPLSLSNVDDIFIIDNPIKQLPEKLSEFDSFESKQKSTFLTSVISANSQYFFENFFQSILSYLKLKTSRQFSDTNILIGGDGRILNDLAIDMFVQIAHGNKVRQINIHPNQYLSIPEAINILEESNYQPSNPDIIILLSAHGEKSGLRGWFGAEILLKDYDFNSTDWLNVVERMMNNRKVNISPFRLLLNEKDARNRKSFTPKSLMKYSANLPSKQFSKMSIINSKSLHSDSLMKKLEKEYDFLSLKSYIQSSGLIVAIDFQNYESVKLPLLPVLKKLGISDINFLNVGVSLNSQSLSASSFGLPSTDMADLFSIPAESIVSVSSLRKVAESLELSYLSS
jgi:hypothetical protein